MFKLNASKLESLHCAQSYFHVLHLLSNKKKQVPQSPALALIAGWVTIVMPFSVFFIHSSHCLMYLISNSSLSPQITTHSSSRKPNLFSTPMLA